MSRILLALRQEFMYVGHLQCCGSLAIIWTAAEVFQAHRPWAMFVAAYAVSYAIYAYNRIAEIETDRITNPERTEYILRHLRERQWSIFIAAALAGVIALSTAAAAGVIFLAALLACGLLYTYYLKSVTRQIFALKTWYVAAAFAAVVFLPFAYAGTEVPSGALPFASWVFIDAAIMQIFLDIKDIASDKEIKLRTIPIVLGKEQTFHLLYASVVVSAIPPLVWGTLHTHFAPAVGALALAPLLSVVPFRIGQKGAYLGYVLESGKFLTWPVLLALGQKWLG